MTKHQSNSIENTVFITSIPASGTQNMAHYCFICKQYWDNTAASGGIRGHMVSEHGFADVG